MFCERDDIRGYVGGEPLMGRVKDYYWDQISAATDNSYSPEPDDLEMLRIDAEQARDRYARALEQKQTKKRDANDKSF